MVKTLTEIIAKLEEFKRQSITRKMERDEFCATMKVPVAKVFAAELAVEQLANVVYSLALHVKRLDDNCPGTHQHDTPVTAGAGGQDA